MQFLKAWNAIRNYAHHHRAASALAENVHTESPDTGDAIGKIRRAFLFEHADRMFVFAHQVARKIVRILRGEAFEPFELQLDELTAEFDLRRAARRKNKVAHMPTSFQHRGDELR